MITGWGPDAIFEYSPEVNPLGTSVVDASSTVAYLLGVATEDERAAMKERAAELKAGRADADHGAASGR